MDPSHNWASPSGVAGVLSGPMYGQVPCLGTAIGPGEEKEWQSQGPRTHFPEGWNCLRWFLARPPPSPRFQRRSFLPPLSASLCASFARRGENPAIKIDFHCWEEGPRRTRDPGKAVGAGVRGPEWGRRKNTGKTRALTASTWGVCVYVESVCVSLCMLCVCVCVCVCATLVPPTDEQHSFTIFPGGCTFGKGCQGIDSG
ncbi:hypothetical protein VTK73DRAFT_5543 [Phialemonium thermophilum]|uniref:Uncharacterized protein n=1 Tax=Phialemonium thermophilum TaxID=223376 RepID=A0ABR3V190_9PEZI